MIIGKPLEKVLDIVGEILAFATITVILISYLNGKFNFLDAETTASFARFREIAIVLVVGLKATEFALKRNIILAIICFVIIGATFVLVFFPGTAPTWVTETLVPLAS